MLDRLRTRNFDLFANNHAEAILSTDFCDQTCELVTALTDFRMSARELIASGGGEAASTQRLRGQLSEAGWAKHNFVVATTIDGETKDSTSHEIDHVRRTECGVIALEIEWNNKDPFFDRDLENFQRLHAQSVISVGIIVTRGEVLQARMLDLITEFVRREGIDANSDLTEYDAKERTVRQREAVEKAVSKGVPFAEAFAKQFVADKFGPSTTHWDKLMDRVRRGVGNPCPLLLIGLPETTIKF